MPTVRESLQADITALETDLAAKKAKLAQFETGFAGVLDRDVEEVKTFVRSIASHLFPHAPTVTPAPVPAVPPAPSA
jgi:hypothetical protein